MQMGNPGEWMAGKTLEQVETEVVLAALRFYQGNKTATAQSLQVSVKTIQNKIVEYIRSGILPEGSYGAPKRIEARS